MPMTLRCQITIMVEIRMVIVRLLRMVERELEDQAGSKKVTMKKLQQMIAQAIDDELETLANSDEESDRILAGDLDAALCEE